MKILYIYIVKLQKNATINKDFGIKPNRTALYCKSATHNEHLKRKRNSLYTMQCDEL